MDSLRIRLGMLAAAAAARDTAKPVDEAAVFSWKNKEARVLPGIMLGGQARLGGRIRPAIYGTLQLFYWGMVKGGVQARENEGGIYLARQAPDLERVNLMLYASRRYPFARFYRDEDGQLITGELGKWSIGIGAGINIY